jgi:hypothetical protein
MVSCTSDWAAERVKTHGVPHLVDALSAGKLSVLAVDRIARLPRGSRADTLATPLVNRQRRRDGDGIGGHLAYGVHDPADVVIQFQHRTLVLRNIVYLQSNETN